MAEQDVNGAGDGGVLMVVVGPSGVGKSSLARRLVAEYPRASFSVSYTTRALRGAEVDGEDYHFVDRATFEAMVGRGEFAEHAEVHGNLYGTSRAVVERALAAGEDVLFDIDVQGAALLRMAFPEATVGVMVVPPSMETLEARLRGRETDSDAVIERRLKAARGELARVDEFDYVVVNDAFDAAWRDFEAVYLACRLATKRRAAAVRALLE